MHGGTFSGLAGFGYMVSATPVMVQHQVAVGGQSRRAGAYLRRCRSNPVQERITTPATATFIQ